MKKIKLLVSLLNLCLCLAALCFGVFSALSINYTANGTVSYNITDVFVQISTQVYRSTAGNLTTEEVLKTNAQSLTTLQQNQINTLQLEATTYSHSAESFDLSTLTLTNPGKPYTPEAADDIAINYGAYDSQVADDQRLGFAYYIVISIKNYGTQTINAVVQNNTTNADSLNSYITETDSVNIDPRTDMSSPGEQKIVIGFALLDPTKNASGDFEYYINITNGELKVPEMKVKPVYSETTTELQSFETYKYKKYTLDFENQQGYAQTENEGVMIYYLYNFETISQINNPKIKLNLVNASTDDVIDDQYIMLGVFGKHFDSVQAMMTDDTAFNYLYGMAENSSELTCSNTGSISSNTEFSILFVILAPQEIDLDVTIELEENFLKYVGQGASQNFSEKLVDTNDYVLNVERTQHAYVNSGNSNENGDRYNTAYYIFNFITSKPLNAETVNLNLSFIDAYGNKNQIPYRIDVVPGYFDQKDNTSVDQINALVEAGNVLFYASNTNEIQLTNITVPQDVQMCMLITFYTTGDDSELIHITDARFVINNNCLNYYANVPTIEYQTSSTNIGTSTPATTYSQVETGVIWEESYLSFYEVEITNIPENANALNLNVVADKPIGEAVAFTYNKSVTNLMSYYIWAMEGRGIQLTRSGEVVTDYEYSLIVDLYQKENGSVKFLVVIGNTTAQSEMSCQFKAEFIEEELLYVFVENGDDDYYKVKGITYGIKEITIPNTYNGLPVKEIGSKAFNQFTNLEVVIIEDGIEIISSDAFYNCTNLKTLKLPYSISADPNTSFYGCDKLECIIIDNINFVNSINTSPMSSQEILYVISTTGETVKVKCNSLSEITSAYLTNTTYFVQPTEIVDGYAVFTRV